MRVIAIVPAYNEEGKIGATVRALLSVDGVDKVVVADDCSIDNTLAEAENAGAHPIRLVKNSGKGAAVNRAISENPGYDIYLLIDGDTGDSATETEKLITPVRLGQADMTVALLKSKQGTGGFGLARRLAKIVVNLMTGVNVTNTLSGQRALNAAALKATFPFRKDYGMETAMTIDALRSDLIVSDVPADFTHSYTYRDAAGFLHRGRQFLDILKVLFRWPYAENFQGKKIPTAVGAAIPLVFAMVMIAIMIFLASVNGSDVWAVLSNRANEANRVVAAWIMIVLVTGLAGFADDVFGSAKARGFRGHIKALLTGHVTTGLLKAASGGLVAIAAAWWIRSEFSPTAIIVDALVIALSINVFNLLDLRPGRALKMFIIVMGALAVFTYASVFWFAPAVAAVFLVAFAIFPFDLRAKAMLGDAGSNVLGGVAGLGLAVTLPDIPKLVVLVMLIALNVISEKWSFTKVIAAVAPLRWLDELGSKK